MKSSTQQINTRDFVEKQWNLMCSLKFLFYPEHTRKIEQDHQSLEVVWAPCIKIAHLCQMVSDDLILLSNVGKLIH